MISISEHFEILKIKSGAIIAILQSRFACIFLPLITVNCAILGGSLFMQERQYDFAQATVFGISAGIGWWFAILLIAAIQERLKDASIPQGLKGFGINMIITGLIAMTFMAFSGLSF